MSSSEETAAAQPQKPYVVNKGVRQTKCRGPKKQCPSGTNTIEKGELRFGTRGELDGRDSMFYRHMQCVTARMLNNKGVTPSTLDDFIEFCVDDGTKMSITAAEARIAKDSLCATLGVPPKQATQKAEPGAQEQKDQAAPSKKKRKTAAVANSNDDEEVENE